MPTEADLPPSLAGLTYRNAIEVDQGRDFHPHVDRLVRGIELHFQQEKPPRFGSSSGRSQEQAAELPITKQIGRSRTIGVDTAATQRHLAALAKQIGRSRTLGVDMADARRGPTPAKETQADRPPTIFAQGTRLLGTTSAMRGFIWGKPQSITIRGVKALILAFGFVVLCIIFSKSGRTTAEGPTGAVILLSVLICFLGTFYQTVWIAVWIVFIILNACSRCCVNCFARHRGG